MPKYKLEYSYNGAIYQLPIYADSYEDAAARVASIKATAELQDGEVIYEEEAGDDVVAWALAGVNALKEQLR